MTWLGISLVGLSCSDCHDDEVPPVHFGSVECLMRMSDCAQRDGKQNRVGRLRRRIGYV
jgi:hypothetical protein